MTTGGKGVSHREERTAASPRSVAVEATLAAGRELRDLFGRVTSIRFKGATDLVTEADERSERLIVDLIQAQFPEHAILTEENGTNWAPNATSDYRWIIDPLDGTTNFAHAYPTFAVSIGLEVAGESRLGVVYAPLLDRLFIAERGQGATLNGRPIHVSQTDALIRSLLASGFQYDRDAARRNLGPWERSLAVAQAVRRDGSATLDLCGVAAGIFDGYWEEGIKPWDTAAGVLLVREAGGTVTTYDGEPFTTGAASCLASNGRIHARLREMVLGVESTAETDTGAAS